MDGTTPLDRETLIQLGFKYDGEVWFHTQEEMFALKLEAASFYIIYHGYRAMHPYNRIVGVLEKEFYERTRRLLY